jgi:hypothetical protein
MSGEQYLNKNRAVMFFSGRDCMLESSIHQP